MNIKDQLTNPWFMKYSAKYTVIRGKIYFKSGWKKREKKSNFITDLDLHVFVKD